MPQRARLAKKNARRHRSEPANTECKFQLQPNSFEILSTFLEFKDLANVASVSKNLNVCTQKTTKSNHLHFFRELDAAKRNLQTLKAEEVAFRQAENLETSEEKYGYPRDSTQPTSLDLYCKSEAFTLNSPIKWAIATHVLLSLIEQYNTQMPPITFGDRFVFMLGSFLGRVCWQAEDYGRFTISDEIKVCSDTIKGLEKDISKITRRFGP